jgi:histidinol-phosphate aminotransferase
LNRLRDPFNVGNLGQHAAIAALKDTEHVQRSIAHNRQELPKLHRGLTDLGFLTTESQANFVLVRTTPGMPDISELYESLLRKAVIIRPVEAYGLKGGARITVGTQEENKRLLRSLRDILAP